MGASRIQLDQSEWPGRDPDSSLGGPLNDLCSASARALLAAIWDSNEDTFIRGTPITSFTNFCREHRRKNSITGSACRTEGQCIPHLRKASNAKRFRLWRYSIQGKMVYPFNGYTWYTVYPSTGRFFWYTRRMVKNGIPFAFARGWKWYFRMVYHFSEIVYHFMTTSEVIFFKMDTKYNGKHKKITTEHDDLKKNFLADENVMKTFITFWHADICGMSSRNS